MSSKMFAPEECLLAGWVGTTKWRSRAQHVEMDDGKMILSKIGFGACIWVRKQVGWLADGMGAYLGIYLWAREQVGWLPG
jgi:hypothetical protein